MKRLFNKNSEITLMTIQSLGGIVKPLNFRNISAGSGILSGSEACRCLGVESPFRI